VTREEERIRELVELVALANGSKRGACACRRTKGTRGRQKETTQRQSTPLALRKAMLAASGTHPLVFVGVKAKSHKIESENLLQQVQRRTLAARRASLARGCLLVSI
jgi:hypothetical protein